MASCRAQDAEQADVGEGGVERSELRRGDDIKRGERVKISSGRLELSAGEGVRWRAGGVQATSWIGSEVDDASRPSLGGSRLAREATTAAAMGEESGERAEGVETRSERATIGGLEESCL